VYIELPGLEVVGSNNCGGRRKNEDGGKEVADVLILISLTRWEQVMLAWCPVSREKLLSLAGRRGSSSK